jgi:hypothetical protein
MLVSIHCPSFPPNLSTVDKHVSTGLRREINPAGSLPAKKSFKLAILPMMSVPFGWL